MLCSSNNKSMCYYYYYSFSTLLKLHPPNESPQIERAQTARRTVHVCRASFPAVPELSGCCRFIGFAKGFWYYWGRVYALERRDHGTFSQK